MTDSLVSARAYTRAVARKMKIRYARAGTSNIAYQVIGEGPIDLVLSPGWATHLELAWEIPDLARFLNELASFTRLILFDKRGTGLSDRPSPDALPSPEQRMSDLQAVMDSARSDSAVLMGTLGGGAMCGMFSATHPERTRALILYGTFANLEPTTGLLARLADSIEIALDRVEREWGDASVGIAAWAPSLLADDEQAEAYLRLLRSSMSPAAARVMMELGYRVDWRASLPAIRVPTLVLHRSGDLIAPATQGRALAEGISGARYVELAGIDHLMWVGDQDSILSEMRRFLDGLGPVSTPQRALATIMFTDIVRSTEMAVQLGDQRWRSVLAEYRRVVRRELSAAGGTEIDTAGDGFLATFEAPAVGIRCAHAIVAAAREIGVDIRAGLHTGECEVTNDGIQGVAVHLAARVSALARPSEVLVSSTVRDLASGAGIAFGERGTYDLKGIPGQWSLYTALSADRR